MTTQTQTETPPGQNRKQKRMNQAKARQLGKQLASKALKKGIIEQVNDILNSFREDINRRWSTLINRCFANQNVLQEEADRLRIQQATELRLLALKVNKIVDHLEATTDEEDWKADPIHKVTFEETNALLREFQEFRKRPDYTLHLETWYTGGDLSSLPPPPEPAPEPEAKKDADTQEILGMDQETPEGADVFGGDYASTHGNSTAKTETGASKNSPSLENPVSELRRTENSPENPPG